MANLQDFIVTGSLILNLTTENTGSVGNIWYDSTDNVIKYSFSGSGGGVWSSGGNLSTFRNFASAGSGTQNAGLAVGGYGLPGRSSTEEYNGTSWSTGGGLLNGVYGHNVTGTQNAALRNGGRITGGGGQSHEYDGSTWTTGGTLSVARYSLGGAGTQNDSVVFAGRTLPPSGQAQRCTEEYDGTSWSAGGDLGIIRFDVGGAGTGINSALVFGGNFNNNDFFNIFAGSTGEYDGTSWSIGGGMGVCRRVPRGAGTQNLALAMSGYPGGSCTEEYNGIVWTAAAAGCNVEAAGGAGTQDAAFAFGGGPSCTRTEEYTQTLGIYTRRL